MKSVFCLCLIFCLQTAMVTAGEDWRNELLSEVNRERATKDLSPLQASAEADGVAQTWAEHLASKQKLIHRQRVEIRNLMGQFNWDAMSENLHYSSTPPSAAEVVRSWMDSPPHRLNLLRRNSTHIGFGKAGGSAGGWYVVANGVTTPKPK